ncbi:hypothetical protein C8Q76DRAFT_839354 [Earliella scabrosa]|nr:hypothetical protein C8Q76DRAFT_839354 [Earliella scabrosa]
MSSTPSWMIRFAFILYTLLVPVTFNVSMPACIPEPSVIFYVLAFITTGFTVTIVSSACVSIVGWLVTVYPHLHHGASAATCTIGRIISSVLATLQFTLQVHHYAYSLLSQHIRRARHAFGVFVVTFAKTFARRLLLAFLRPIGLAIQTTLVLATTLFIDALTAVVFGAGYAVVCGIQLVWGRRGTPLRLFWTGLVGLGKMVCDVYEIAKAEACAAYNQDFDEELASSNIAAAAATTFTDYDSDTTIPITISDSSSFEESDDYTWDSDDSDLSDIDTPIDCSGPDLVRSTGLHKLTLMPAYTVQDTFGALL